MLTVRRRSAREHTAASASVFCFNQVKRCDPDAPSSLGSSSWRCEQHQWRERFLPGLLRLLGAPAGRVSPGKGWGSGVDRGPQGKLSGGQATVLLSAFWRGRPIRPLPLTEHLLRVSVEGRAIKMPTMTVVPAADIYEQL